MKAEIVEVVVNGLPARVQVPEGVRLVFCRSLIPKAERVPGQSPWTEPDYAFTVDEEGFTLLHWTNDEGSNYPVVVSGLIGLKHFDKAPDGPMVRSVRLA